MPKNIGTIWEIQISRSGFNPNIRKLRAYEYYMDPSSPSFMNAYRSLIRVGYSRSYAKSYCGKVFDMRRFLEVMTRSYLGKYLVHNITQRYMEP